MPEILQLSYQLIISLYHICTTNRPALAADQACLSRVWCQVFNRICLCLGNKKSCCNKKPIKFILYWAHIYFSGNMLIHFKLMSRRLAVLGALLFSALQTKGTISSQLKKVTRFSFCTFLVSFCYTRRWYPNELCTVWGCYQYVEHQPLLKASNFCT